MGKAPARFSDRLATPLGLCLLALLYLRAYFQHPARPSPSARYPEGWWGWFDQSKYLESARALAHADFNAAHHWYPFGYALLGAPFLWAGAHLYLLPDLACLLIVAVAFLDVARALRVPLPVAVAIMIGTTMFPEPVRQAWAVPWNTTLAAALIWTALAQATRLVLLADAGRRTKKRLRHFVLLGAVLALIPVARPTDALVAAEIAATCVRLLPVARATGAPGVMMAQIRERPGSWPDVYFRDFRIVDSLGSEKNINDFRSLPDSQGERWIALHRPFAQGLHAEMPPGLLPPHMRNGGCA